MNEKDLHFKVLVVDDEPQIVESTKLWLERVGYQVVTAVNGQQAIDATVESQPQLIVMDVRMPIMDGLTALTELKGKPETKEIPVIILSASIVDKQFALDSGAVCFLSKPYPGVDLVKVVNSIRRSQQVSL